MVSRDNPAIRQAAKLLRSAKHRRREGLFPAEGVRLCRDAALSGIQIVQFFYTGQAEKKYSQAVEELCRAAQKSAEVSDAVMQALCDTEAPQGVFCVCRMLDKKNECVYKKNTGGRILVLETIQDPSNLGTILRTAEALGIDGVLLSEDSCDLYSPKVLRGSMGAVFRLPVEVTCDLAETVTSLREIGFTVYAAVPAEDATPVTSLLFYQKCAIVVGNEGNGLTEKTIEACNERVTIPMLGRAESLNAATAASILMWEMVRGQKTEMGRLHE